MLFSRMWHINITHLISSVCSVAIELLIVYNNIFLWPEFEHDVSKCGVAKNLFCEGLVV